MRYFARLLSFSLASGALLLTGCGLGDQATGGASIAGAALISGTVHGGQQPVYNATVRLYSAGTTGYGTGSTLLATSLPTLTNGNFTFAKSATNGASTGTTPVWACPTTGNPIIYITAVGGNTQGTGTTATNNAASAMLSVLGPCSGITAATPVSINEITTVGSVFAMAQYINPGTTAGTMTMGTSSATGQANTGIINAAASINNIADITGGNPAPPRPNSGAPNSSAAGIVVTATSEAAKVVTLADILASCINQTSATSANNCTDLFANALPPVLASATSQPSATFAAPVDTIQAAYYLATNPGALASTAFPAPAICNNTGAAATTMTCLFGLVGGTAAPFAGGLTAVPSDWTIGVTYTATGTCVGGGAFIYGATKASVDANGNLWFINGGATSPSAGSYANLSELSPTGVPLACLANSSNGRGLTIDPTGNIWASFNTTTPLGASSVASLLELPVNAAAPVSNSSLILWTAATSTGASFTPYTATSDGLGNIFFTNISFGGQLLEFVTPGTSTTPTAAVLLTGGTTGFNGTASTTTNYSASDASNHIWVDTSSVSSIYENFITPGTPPTGTFGTTAEKTTGYGVAIDSSNFVYNGTTCCGTGTTNYKEIEKIFPGSTGIGTVAASTQYLGGVNGVRSVQLDGAANVWAGNEFSSTAANITTFSNYPVAEIATTTTAGSTAANFIANTTFTALSPTGTAPATCSTTAGCPTGGGFIKNDFVEIRDLGIDPSGNVWALNTGNESSAYSGTTITEIVGAAVPTVTPLSAAIAAGKLAQKP